jgi:predicted metallopeptidase
MSQKYVRRLSASIQVSFDREGNDKKVKVIKRGLLYIPRDKLHGFKGSPFNFINDLCVFGCRRIQLYNRGSCQIAIKRGIIMKRTLSFRFTPLAARPTTYENENYLR